MAAPSNKANCVTMEPLFVVVCEECGHILKLDNTVWQLKRRLFLSLVCLLLAIVFEWIK